MPYNQNQKLVFKTKNFSFVMILDFFALVQRIGTYPQRGEPKTLTTALHFLHNLQWAQKARVLHSNRLETLATDKHSC